MLALLKSRVLALQANEKQLSLLSIYVLSLQSFANPAPFTAALKSASCFVLLCDHHLTDDANNSRK